MNNLYVLKNENGNLIITDNPDDFDYFQCKEVITVDNVKSIIVKNKSVSFTQYI